ncbi:cellular tumor antigen p53-like [Candoia aspera]|uniref:cellular tumor antigen p53-like n=1 Tax=Candoia aspera TaxID=51853 RepID=UPI002FD808CC
MRVSHPLPSGSIIRAMAVFRHPKDAAEVVRCCPLHEQLLRDRGDVAHPEHLIQVEWNNRAQYFSDSETKRCSVTVPFQESRKSSIVWYKYMCSTSCFVGMNRRPILTTITLESPQGSIIGQRCFEVEIYRRGMPPSPGIWRPSISRLEEKLHHLDLEGLEEDLERQGAPTCKEKGGFDHVVAVAIFSTPLTTTDDPGSLWEPRFSLQFLRKKRNGEERTLPPRGCPGGLDGG